MKERVSHCQEGFGMDLKRKLGLGTGQSYELIRSTQSLVDRLNLNTGDISIQPVHPSIMGQVTWATWCTCGVRTHDTGGRLYSCLVKHRNAYLIRLFTLEATHSLEEVLEN